MASQLNPAWQRKAASADHLEKISERFLSDSPSQEPSPDGCHLIPFLMGDPGDFWIVDDLARVLTKRGHRNLIYDAGRDSRDWSPHELENTLQAQDPDNEFCLFRTSSTQCIQQLGINRLVLLVPSNLDAVVTAYQHIKLLSRQSTPDFGIVMVGPRDQHAAWRYFRKLAVGSLRYLDVPLLNLGFLPKEVLPEAGPANHHRQNFLTRISERILRSGFHCTPINQSGHKAKRL